MSVTYESRIPLSDIWCKLQGGGGVENIHQYLIRYIRGANALALLKLEPKRDKRNWFVIRYGKGRQRQEIPVGRESLVECDVTFKRIAFDLGWIDSNEWDDNQVTWRLDTRDERKPLSVSAFLVVASRKAPYHQFEITEGSTNYTWVPLQAMFPDLPRNAFFVGWKRAEIEAKRLELEKTDEKFMFEKFFPSVYRNYVRCLLHLPIAVGGKIVKTVDFRDADAKAFLPLLDHSKCSSPDAMFYAMVTFRVKIRVSEDGRLLAIPHLPNRPGNTNFIKLCASDLEKGADIVPVETSVRRPNCCVQFPLVNTKDCVVVNMATLSHLDLFHFSIYVQQHIFPHCPLNLTENVITKNFTWRMHWEYALHKPLPIPYKSRRDTRSYVYISLLKPWY